MYYIKIVSVLGMATFFLEIISVMLLLMRNKEKRSYFWIRFIILMAIGMLFKFVDGHKIRIGIIQMSYFVVVCYSILMGFLLFKTKIVSAIFYGFASWAAQHIAWNSYVIVCREIRPTLFWTIILYFSFYILVYGLLTILTTILRINYDARSESVFAAILSLIIFFFTSIMEDLIHSSGGLKYSNAFYGLIICTLLLTIEFFTAERGNLRLKNTDLQKENDMLEGIILQEKRQQKMNEEVTEILNRKCHDLRHNISVLRTMNKDEIDDYIKKLEDTITIYGDIAKTGNKALDVIISEKAFLCEDLNIKFTYIIDSDKLSFIDPINLSSLFGNMLDNAIECVKKEEINSRVIHLNITDSKGLLYICCENYCSEERKFIDNFPITTKTDKNYHGYGIKSMKYICEKYNGIFKTTYEDKTFSVDIVIPTPKQS